ncbi:tyrosine-type recombinase/integrase, partial [uncultured Bacteroides sp.]|uniref:tyrosine-type recombinase/integrase n=1 Tax=uncultured Bacteroides sp. TaxID=162156 RepID=UPI0025AF6ABD
FSTWQNAEIPFISNGLRFIFTCPLFLAQPITFHCTRHTFGTMMLTLGADLFTTSKLMGHSNIQTTEIYAKIVDKKKEDYMSLLLIVLC